MLDQASKLRSLVETAEPAVGAGGRALPMVVVSGARGGVGTTTVAINLAAVLADRGERVLVVDGAQQRNCLAEPTGVRAEANYSLADVLAGKCTIDEATVAGPAGVKMLVNRWTPRSSPDFSRRAQQRLMTELESLEDRFDLIVVDAGRGLSPWSQRFWSQAELILLVATTEDAVVLDAYAAVKASTTVANEMPVRLLVNQAENNASAREAHRRVENACQRFLSRAVPSLPALPRQVANDFVGGRVAPRVWERPDTPFGHAALWLGRAVDEALNERRMQGAGCRGQEHDETDHIEQSNAGRTLR